MPRSTGKRPPRRKPKLVSANTFSTILPTPLFLIYSILGVKLIQFAAISSEDAKKRFHDGLFDQKKLDSYTTEYAESSPYKHAVIHGLINDRLLRSVRDEIRNNVEFTPKETDIYKIHQSGDLANLDGLDDESLAKLPSLLTLRDAIYSESFRDYISHITACGPLSGRKTDMAINVYTPGCYLLCHDDVIGSRRVSYILYLTDPDTPWQSEWGGALRLFPVQEITNKDGEVAKTPLPDAVKTIPPGWNQLSFFAVQPGESFHDVEEVYHAKTKEELEKQGGRVRMAISGWFHIPQIGEEGYIKGEEEKNAKNSSLMQLQGNPAQYDAPQKQAVPITNPKAKVESSGFEEEDLEFLLKYMAPIYLTPDALEDVVEHFEEASCITLPNLLSKKFSTRLREEIGLQEKNGLPDTQAEIEKGSAWRLAKPPHKHRYLYQHPSGPDQLRTSQEESAITELLDIFLPSRQFRQWLQMATSTTIENHDIIARRFRRGKDYTLATGHEGKPQLEVNLSLTPTSGWGEEEALEEEAAEEEVQDKKKEFKKAGKGKGKAKAPAPEPEPSTDDKEPEDGEVGGHVVYMAGDDEDDNEEGGDNADAAIYKSSNDEDNILFHQAASWNKLSIVMRDSGVLNFVKYVSRKANGDRWDIVGTFGIEEEEEDGNEEEEKDDDDDEDEFQGFSDNNDDSESD